MIKRFWRKKKLHILVAAACLLIFAVVPLLLLWRYGADRGELAMGDFLALIFWPGAGTALSAFYAWSVRENKIWLLVPCITILGIGLCNLVVPKLHFFRSLLCLLFELAGYGMIHFWLKLED
jgi:hypothetical protein